MQRIGTDREKIAAHYITVAAIVFLLREQILANAVTFYSKITEKIRLQFQIYSADL